MTTSAPAPRRLALLAAPLLLLGSAGCKSSPPPPDDAALTAAIQSRLSADSALNPEQIQAAVQAGVATLNGTVSNDAARALAANDAAQVSGIRTVVNNLTVAAPAPAPAEAPAAAEAAPPVSTQPSAATTARADREAARRREREARLQAAAARRAAQAPAPPAAAPVERASAPLPPPPPAPVVSTPPPYSPPKPVVRTVSVPTGTVLPVRISQTLDSATTQQGDSFSGVLSSDLLIDGVTVLPQGTPVSGRVIAVQEAGHFKGNSLLSVELTGLNRRGDHIAVSTEAYTAEGKGRGKNTAEKVGGGAAVGAILGGIFGGGRGAGIGAAAGGGLGAGAQAITRGQQVQIPAESLVRFRLSTPFTVRVSSANDLSSPSTEGSGRRPLPPSN